MSYQPPNNLPDSFLPEGEELTAEDREEADFLAKRFRQEPRFAQMVRAETMNVLKLEAQMEPNRRKRRKLERIFDLIKQEALDAERSADRPLGIRGRVRVWYRSHCHWSPRGALQWVSRLVRGVVASLSRLRSR